MLLQCDGRTDCQTVKGDGRKMTSPWEAKGGGGGGGGGGGLRGRRGEDSKMIFVVLRGERCENGKKKRFCNVTGGLTIKQLKEMGGR